MVQMKALRDQGASMTKELKKAMSHASRRENACVWRIADSGEILAETSAQANDRSSVVWEYEIDVPLVQALGILGVVPNVFVKVPTAALIEDHEHRDEFAINVLGRSVGLCLASRTDNHRADQAGVDVVIFIDMRLVGDTAFHYDWLVERGGFEPPRPFRIRRSEFNASLAD